MEAGLGEALEAGATMQPGVAAEARPVKAEAVRPGLLPEVAGLDLRKAGSSMKGLAQKLGGPLGRS